MGVCGADERGGGERRQRDRSAATEADRTGEGRTGGGGDWASDAVRAGEGRERPDVYNVRVVGFVQWPNKAIAVFELQALEPWLRRGSLVVVAGDLLSVGADDSGMVGHFYR
jgi:hypothetical protein